MRVATLPARNVENPRAYRQRQHVEQSRYLAPVALGRKKRFVLQEVAGIERGFPPLAPFSQKNTGSR